MIAIIISAVVVMYVCAFVVGWASAEASYQKGRRDEFKHCDDQGWLRRW